MKCIYCKAENSETACFCHICGKKIDEQSIVSSIKLANNANVNEQIIVSNRSDLTFEAYKLIIFDVIVVVISILVLVVMLFLYN